MGWRGAITWFGYRLRQELGLKQPAVLTLRHRRCLHPVKARLGGSSDVDVFGQVFQQDEYRWAAAIPSPRLIIDLGANVGYSSAYLLSCFPACPTVLAVEPDPDNYALCCLNLAAYGNRARVLRGAAWSKPCSLVLSRGTFGDGREWATQVLSCDSGDPSATVEAWDIPRLLQFAGAERVDILKIDIEGSEVELFRTGASAWLPAVRNLCIELHGPDSKRVFFQALSNFDYDLCHSGELTILRNLRPKASFLSLVDDRLDLHDLRPY